MNSHQLVEPRDAENLSDQIISLFLAAGLDERDSHWLSTFLFSPGLFDRNALTGDPKRADEFLNALEAVAQAVLQEKRGDRDAQLGALLFRLAGLHANWCAALTPQAPAKFPFSDGFVEPVLIPEWLPGFLDQSAICPAKLLTLLKPDWVAHQRFVHTVLLPRLDLATVLDWSKLPRTKRAEWKSSDFENFQCLEFWLALDCSWKLARHCRGEPSDLERSEVLSRLVPAVAAMPKEEIPGTVIGILHALEDACVIGYRPTEADKYRLFAADLLPLLKLIEGLNPATSEDKQLRTAWRLAAYRICGREFGGLAEGLEPAARKLLIEQSQIDLGHLRTELRTGSAAWDWRYAQECMMTLRNLAKPWELLGPLLQAFRCLPSAGVTADLRYWGENGMAEQPQQPWSWIPMWIAAALYADHLQADLAADPELRELREALAGYCLKRLKSRDRAQPASNPAQRAGADMVEPSAWWRRCYVKAVAELRVNPGGRSHHVLHWSSEHDPDELVRAYARAAYKGMRHQQPLPDQSSPRRPLMAAFWWLRQAHRLELGLPVDAEGAQRTRTKELRRIKERDQTAAN